MKSNLYTAIVKKAAHEYFCESDLPLSRLNNRQHRMLVEAVHETYSRLVDERERKLIESVYRDDAQKFVDAVKYHAKACGAKERWAWKVIDRFAFKVMECADLQIMETTQRKSIVT